MKPSNVAFQIIRAATFVILAASVAKAIPALLAQEKKLNWYKGNTHTHTINSDGDSTPDEVVRWYREHKYNFLVLSDHNYLTEVDGLNSVFGAANQFLLIKGEELTDEFQKNACAGRPHWSPRPRTAGSR